MLAQKLSRWPVTGGYLERLGLPPEEIEARSRQVARGLVGTRWREEEADLAAALLYAAGDPGLIEDLRFGGDPVGSARAALANGAALLVDVTMVGSGIRLPAGPRLAPWHPAPGAPAHARRAHPTPHPRRVEP